MMKYTALFFAALRPCKLSAEDLPGKRIPTRIGIVLTKPTAKPQVTLTIRPVEKP